MLLCATLFAESKASYMFLSARNEQEEQEEKREIKRRLTRKVRKFSAESWGRRRECFPHLCPLLAPVALQRPVPLQAWCVLPHLAVRVCRCLDSPGPLQGAVAHSAA